MHRRDLLNRAVLIGAGLVLPSGWHARVRAWLAQPSPVVEWLWCGGATTDSLTVVAKVTGHRGPVFLQLEGGPQGRPVQLAGHAAPAAPEVFRFVAAHLEPGTRYTYRIAIDDMALAPSGRARTFPAGPSSFTVLFGSCASTGSNAAIWDTMRAADADLFVHMGDFHYENIRRNEPARFRRAYDRCLRSPRQGAFYRSLPIAYVWDDHDFGDNESDGRSPSAPAAHQVYREYVPHYPLAGGPTGTIQQAFSIGRVRVIVTDSRSARDVPGRDTFRSMLGAAQRSWLQRELEAAAETAALVVWANPVPWITKADERTLHGWAPYHAERAWIAGEIERLGLTRRLVILGGDAHMAAIDDGTNSQYAESTASRMGPVVVHASPFDRFRNRKGGPYSQGSRARRGQFGELRVVDDGTSLEAVLTARDQRGHQIDKLSIRLVVAGSTYRVETVAHQKQRQGGGREPLGVPGRRL